MPRHSVVDPPLFFLVHLLASVDAVAVDFVGAVFVVDAT